MFKIFKQITYIVQLKRKLFNKHGMLIQIILKYLTYLKEVNKMNAVAIAMFFAGISVGSILMTVIIILMDAADYYRRMKYGK